ncbi:MAG: hypothetical protein J7K73_02855 [Nanoarchaeota archaeon]|nr:hypothetical protein [Nanoarchaeota archaeon]
MGRRRVATSIYGTKNVYSSYCLTLAEKLGRGDPLVVDGREVLGVKITRAGIMLVEDENGFIYQLIGDSCLTDPNDAQIGAICSDCEFYWMRKLGRREYRLIGRTVDHLHKFEDKFASHYSTLSKAIDKLTPRKYLTFVGNSMRHLSLTDGSMIVPFSDGTSVMFGELKKVGDEDLYMLVIADFDDDSKFVASGVIDKRGEFVRSIVDGDDPLTAYAQTAGQIHESLIESLEVF